MKTLTRMDMMGMSRCFFFAFLSGIARIVMIHAQGTSGFINIDCGLSSRPSYTDPDTGIFYNSDASFIDTGKDYTVAGEVRAKQYSNLRIFPQGTRNCYTLTPAQGKGSRYLIRASFMYGNYDSLNQMPKFDMYIGADWWDTVILSDPSTPRRLEIIHVLSTNYVSVCLMNTGSGTPFISALELRPLDNSLNIYRTTFGSLNKYVRLNLGSTGANVRYKDDVCDRIWTPNLLGQPMLNTTSDVVANFYNVPSDVMSSCIVSGGNNSIDFLMVPENSTDKFYIYMHFAELQVLQPNQTRQFLVFLNGDLMYGPYSPKYLSTFTLYAGEPKTYPKFQFYINATSNSTLPPIINAIEVYNVRQISSVLTDEQDVVTMMNIKSTYKVIKNWQGDPCVPKTLTWLGIGCSYIEFDTPRIISLNMSLSNLSGAITPFISNLTMLQYLDLSNNSLTGEVPTFLAQMGSLKTLNLIGNNFSSIPNELLAKRDKGLLTLSFDNTDIKTAPPSSPTKKKKGNVIVPVVASVVGAALLIVAVMLVLGLVKRKEPSDTRKEDPETIEDRRKPTNSSIEVRNREYSYAEVLSMTNNFNRVIGKGGFGTVFYGSVGEIQVAAKMLSPSSVQGYKEFQAEANILMSVHHKNLTSLVGYCIEGTHMGIIYEYMANGNLNHHLSTKIRNPLSWEERLQIATDAAQGLEYLHHGCKPPIVHRDVKSTNILLSDSFQAKLADFGLSRSSPVEGESHVSTIVAGTPGYLDPDYYMSSKLSEKSDIYSFGIVILEMITGRPAMTRGQDAVHIVQWMNSRLSIGDITNVADPRLKGDYEVSSVWKAVEVAMECVSPISTIRPTMNHVVLELKECLAMETGRGESSTIPSGFSFKNLDVGVGPHAR